MPKYHYKCSECEQVLFVYHDISDKLKDCEQCNTEDSLIRLPSVFRTENKSFSQTNVGHRIKKAIEELDSELKQEKVRLKEAILINDE